ncbi:uncharacterized protein EI97DRAFT_441810 [Westerdykella ornata]|uniref:Uncharacterized protein n=1 Tax=Westerdykella ornata TaxID=318751 RepID=A0A6A6JKK4_WESOR|nr:uncharacterized protein EI97DRAFT_441810 [Westerdykella ornata]KAF2277047.1 hypothetical protein EI97DRAFT_441810 [Westerdykella ornata]
MTHNYVDQSVQTDIAGLTRHLPPNLPLLCHPSTTPPEDMPNEKLHPSDAAAPSSLLLRRKNRPASLANRMPIPPNVCNDEVPLSPPPTETLLSPLPLANRLHAGHTPIIPALFSPLQNELLEEKSRERTPDMDEPLRGPLSLPLLPGDGADDRIELKVLDAELEKIAKAQQQDSTSNPVREDAQPHSQKRSTESRRRSSTDDIEVVDGVILKKPRMNFGAPLGQAAPMNPVSDI